MFGRLPVLMFAIVVTSICWFAMAVSGREQGAPSGNAPLKIGVPGSDSQALITKDDEKKTAAAFDKAFNEYRDAISRIEQLRIAYQTADAAKRQKINADLPALAAKAKTLVNAMIDAGMEAYRVAPNDDPRVTELLVDMAKHYVVGQQVGGGQPEAEARLDRRYYPIEGGDQYERGLPIIKRLVDGGATEKKLYVWGFLAAFVTNDYDLAGDYLKKAQESQALEEYGKAAQDVANNRDAGLDAQVMRTVMNYADSIDKYRELWAKESAIRAAEAQADDLPRVKFTTTKGDITIELFENDAPQSVANFLTLVKLGFYDGSPFHRVLPMFMAQGGAKSDDGEGGPGYTIRCECYTPNYRHHFRGTLSMAHRGRDTGSSQFFLTFVPTGHLDGLHTAFGRVIEGIDVLGEIQKRSPGQQQVLPKADRILKAVVLRDRGHEYKFEKLPE